MLWLAYPEDWTKNSLSSPTGAGMINVEKPRNLFKNMILQSLTSSDKMDRIDVNRNGRDK